MTLICITLAFKLIMIFPSPVYSDKYVIFRVGQSEELISKKAANKLIKDFLKDKTMNCELYTAKN